MLGLCEYICRWKLISRGKSDASETEGGRRDESIDIRRVPLNIRNARIISSLFIIFENDEDKVMLASIANVKWNVSIASLDRGNSHLEKDAFT